MNKITSWSFSRWKDYTTCPAKAMYKHVLKMKEPSSPAMERGTLLHKACEDFINMEVDVIPEELRKFEKALNFLRSLPNDKCITEESLVFKDDWTPTVWNDWARAWLRIRVDCSYSLEGGTLRLIDWKTGKFREDEVEMYWLQLELCALGVFLSMKSINYVIPKLVFLDEGIIWPTEPRVYSNTKVGELKNSWLDRIRPMMSDTTFTPKPNRLCSWCTFSKSNGGPCKY